MPDQVSARTLTDRIAPHWKGHVFLFGATSPPAYDAATGFRLLLIFALLEGIIGPRLWLLSWLQLPAPPAWFRAPMLLICALMLVVYFARLPLPQIGLYPWREWSRTEKSYFLQVLVLANAIFFVLFSGRLQRILADGSLWGPASVVLLTYLVWGFYQELMYRGILQTELVRRWGSWAGILVSNAIFTLGPLHFYHFSGGAPAKTLAMFGSIFAIGLFFAILFRRSGNLWIIGIFHGIGDFYMSGLGELGR